ncbi:GlcNAc-PI de-N-acetylase [Actinomycetes bacterium]|nr:GlcNAc-PI de-N-acetylase [Actinomycetes bacterium]
MLDDGDVSRVLVITAHPDDVDFGAAGTVAGWVAQGITVTYCIITDGDAGGADPNVPRGAIAGIRQGEQRAAGAVLGVTDIRFLGYRDGELTVSHDLRRDLSRVIRQVRPERVLMQSPDRNWKRIYASHPDHLAAGEAAIFAIYPDARNPFAHTALLQDEGLADWAVPEVWVMGSPTPNHYVDVTDRFDIKLAALLAHTSQTGHMEDLAGRITGWLTMQGIEAGLAEGRMAESFMVVDTA